MEMTTVEVSAVSEAAAKVEKVVVELADLELVMVGGGTGDIHF